MIRAKTDAGTMRHRGLWRFALLLADQVATAIQRLTASAAAFHSPATAEALQSLNRSCSVSIAANALRSAIVTSRDVRAVGSSVLKQAIRWRASSKGLMSAVRMTERQYRALRQLNRSDMQSRHHINRFERTRYRSETCLGFRPRVNGKEKVSFANQRSPTWTCSTETTHIILVASWRRHMRAAGCLS